MTQIISLAVTFEVEAEDELDNSRIHALRDDIEDALLPIEGVHFASADLCRSTRRYQVVVEVEGDSPDIIACHEAMVDAVRARVPKLVREPWVGDPLVVDDDDVA